MRRLMLRTAGLALMGALAIALASPASADTKGTRKSTIPAPFVTGSFIDASGGQGVFQGHLKLGAFEARGASVVSTGELTGTLADSQGAAIGRVGQPVAWTVTGVEGGCEGVKLTLAATEMTLDDRSVKLDEIVLDVTAANQPQRARQAICDAAAASKSAAAPGDLAGRLSDLFRVVR